MVRAKKTVDTSKQLEVQALLEKLKLKFKESKQDLEEAKREFSTTYVQEVMKELELAVSEDLLNMRAKDFAYYVKQFGSKNTASNNNKLAMDLQTPLQTRRKFKSITTPSGVNMQIPSLITPRIDGAVLRSRMSRQGEVLFSMNGTPVTLDVDPPEINSANAKEQAKAVQELLQQNESEMSPATLKIMKQLRVVLDKKTFD